MPAPIGAHDSLRAQVVQRWVRLTDGRFPVLVGVVDEEDVDAVEAEAGQAVLDRPKHAVARVVEDDPPVGHVAERLVVDAVTGLAIDVGAGWDLVVRDDQATDLRADGELVARAVL